MGMSHNFQWFPCWKDSRHRIEEEILRADALREAAELAFCPLCLRPLQQFPDEAPVTSNYGFWWCLFNHSHSIMATFVGIFVCHASSDWISLVMTSMFRVFPHAIMSCMYVSCMYRFIYYLAWDMDVWFVSEVFSVTLSLIEGWCCCGWSGQKTWEHVAARLHMMHLVKHGRLCLCCASCFAGITDVVFFILQMAGAVLVVVMPHGQRSLHRCWCKKQVLPKAGGLCHHSPRFQIGHLGKRRNMWVRSVKDLELWKAMGNTRCIHPHLFERTVAVALCSMWMRQGLWRVALVWAPWCPTWGRCNCIGMLLPLRSSAKSKLSDDHGSQQCEEFWIQTVFS